MASISAWTWGSGGGTSFGGGGAFAWGGGGGGFLPWGGGGGFFAPGGGIGGFFAAPGGGLGGGGLSPFGGGMGAFFVGGTGGFLGGGGGLGFLASPFGGGGFGLASLDSAPVAGASLAAASSFWPSPESPDHQLDQEPAAACAHSNATSRRLSMMDLYAADFSLWRNLVAERLASEDGSDSAAKPLQPSCS